MFALIVENVRNALQQLFLYLKRLGEVKKFKSTINANIAQKKPFRSFFPFIFVTRVNPLIQMNEKTDSKGLSLATVSILRQPPRSLYELVNCINVRIKLHLKELFLVHV